MIRVGYGLGRRLIGRNSGYLQAPLRGFHGSLSRYEVVPFLLSDIGEGIKEVTIKEWFVSPGDKVSQFDQICEVQSDKASVTITSRFDGKIAKLYYQVDDLAQTGDPLVDIDLGNETEIKEEVSVAETEAINVTDGSKPLATPAVRRMASENDVNLNDVVGSGKHGRILKEDVLEFIEGGGANRVPPPVAKKAVTPPPTPPTAVKKSQPIASKKKIIVDKEDKVVPMSPYVKAMNTAMTESLKIPHFGYCDEIDMSKLVKLRKIVKKTLDLKISYMPFIIKATSLSLASHEILNSTPNFDNSTFTYRSAHNIGIAMDTSNGLLVPNIKNVEELTVIEIHNELNRLQDLAYKGKLGNAELSGGTFSLSNIGSIGGTYAKPVIVGGTVAIGALGKIQTLPRFDYDGNVVKASVMNVSWSADHRCIDGATIARFSNLLKDYLENPEKMVLNMK